MGWAFPRLPCRDGAQRPYKLDNSASFSVSLALDRGREIDARYCFYYLVPSVKPTSVTILQTTRSAQPLSTASTYLRVRLSCKRLIEPYNVLQLSPLYFSDEAARS